MDVPTEAYNMNEGPIHSRWRIWCFAAPRAFVKDKGILCGLCCRSCRTSKQKIHSCFWPLATSVFHIYSGNEDENGNQLLSLFFALFSPFFYRICCKNQVQLMPQEMWYLVTLVFTCNRRSVFDKFFPWVDFIIYCLFCELGVAFKVHFTTICSFAIAKPRISQSFCFLLLLSFSEISQLPIIYWH